MSRRFSAVQVILLVGLLGVAGLMRVHEIGAEDLWFDELWSLLDASGRQAEFLGLSHGEVLRDTPKLTAPLPETSAGDLWSGMQTETHPPLYFLVLALWRSWFGDGAAALRTLAAACSWLTLFPLAWAVWRWWGSTAALWTVVFAAFAAGDLAMAQSVRHYAPAGLWVALSFALLAGWAHPEGRTDGPAGEASATSRRRNVLWGASYGLTLYLAMLTHYMSALPLVGQAIWAMRFTTGPRRRAWALATILAAATYLVTWGPSALAQWRYTQGSDEKIVFLAHQPVWRTPAELLTAPIRLLAPVRPIALTVPLADGEPLELFTDVASHDLSVAAVGAILVAVCLRGAMRRRGPALWFFAAWFGAPLLALAMGELVTGLTLLHHLRYPYFGVHGLCALIPIALGGLLHRRGTLVLAALATIGFLLATAGYPTRRNPAATAAAAFVTSAVAPGELLVLDAYGAQPYEARRLFLLLNHHAAAPLPPTILLRGEPSPETSTRLAGFDRLWLAHVWPDMEHTPLPAEFISADVASPYFYGIGWFLKVEKGMPAEAEDATGG